MELLVGPREQMSCEAILGGRDIRLPALGALKLLLYPFAWGDSSGTADWGGGGELMSVNA